MARFKSIHWAGPDGQGEILCGQEALHHKVTVIKTEVTCRKCLKAMGKEKPTLRCKAHPSDWNWPLKQSTVLNERRKRSIVLYNFYHNEYRRRLTWHPAEDTYVVRCEDKHFECFELKDALKHYNDKELHVENS